LLFDELFTTSLDASEIWDLERGESSRRTFLFCLELCLITAGWPVFFSEGELAAAFWLRHDAFGIVRVGERLKSLVGELEGVRGFHEGASHPW